MISAILPINDSIAVLTKALRQKLLLAYAVALLLILTAQNTQAQTYYLGVLAPQGEAVAQQRWQPWLDELNNTLQQDTIVLVPLALENWQQQIEAKQFALVLGPQIQVIKMDTAGWRWLATFQSNVTTAKPSEFQISDINQSDFQTAAQYKLYKQLKNDLALLEQQKANNAISQPSAMEQIASALWVNKDSDIQQLRDLERRKIVAVAPDAFGGYLLIAHLLKQNSLTPSDYQTQFVGYPIELTLSTLASGAVDAAIAPLCLMEEMASQGKLDQAQFRLLHPLTTDSSCQSSTKIYPNWTLAATDQAPTALINQISPQLFSEPANDRSNPSLSWLSPESSVDAERILYEMNEHPAQKTLGSYIIEWIQSHRWWMSIIVLIILVSTINYAWMSWLAWRRQQQLLIQNRLIRDYDQQLRHSERFAVIGEMSGAIAHEINQPLATIQNYAQGLLIRSENPVQGGDNNHEDSTDKQRLDKRTTQKALKQIVNETQRVAAVINNIRRWAGRPAADEISVDIAATYKQCIYFMGERAVDISFWLASDYQTLQLPNLLLDQLLINAILNAQQQGAQHIILRCSQEQYQGKDWLAISVIDDAGGFDQRRLSANQAALANGPKYSETSTKLEGLGLGLMICQRLCKSLDGMMQLSNIEVQEELAIIKDVSMSYQLRLKHTLDSKNQLIQTQSYYPFKEKVGAKVTLYLPLHLADDKLNKN
ncbi:PhnD/SsuA/transferrin family substrate-binding protein [Psychrobacter sp. 1U2]